MVPFNLEGKREKVSPPWFLGNFTGWDSTTPEGNAKRVPMKWGAGRDFWSIWWEGSDSGMRS